MSAFWLWLAYLLSFIQLACVSVSLLLAAACCPVGKHWAGNFNTPYVQPQGIEVSMVKQTEWQGSVRAMVPLSALETACGQVTWAVSILMVLVIPSVLF